MPCPALAEGDRLSPDLDGFFSMYNPKVVSSVLSGTVLRALGGERALGRCRGAAPGGRGAARIHGSVVLGQKSP